ncbi:MAG: response regulator transcription factor [Bacteroidetes bacterium]|jgi:two-component system LytT family response regulator|nr:response regulator transcription factor [Bacteroidota bacterium]
MMKAVIVDDELSIHNSIRNILNLKYSDIDLAASAESVKEGVESIIRYKPDLVFLDIEMPDGTGFDLIDRLTPTDFKTIFITAHQEYALDAIKVSALDFILKPFTTEDLCAAIDKAAGILNIEEEQLKLKALLENIKNRKSLRRIVLNTADNLHIIELKNIVRAEADSNYTRFILTDGNTIMVSRTIKEFDGLLSNSGMIRVHQSHLVNISHVDRFVKRDGGYLVLKDNSKIPVSQNMRKQVIHEISNSQYL